MNSDKSTEAQNLEPAEIPLPNRSEIVAVVLTAGVTLVVGEKLSWWCTAIGLILIGFLLGYHDRLEGRIRRFELMAYSGVWGLSIVLFAAPFIQILADYISHHRGHSKDCFPPDGPDGLGLGVWLLASLTENWLLLRSASSTRFSCIF